MRGWSPDVGWGISKVPWAETVQEAIDFVERDFHGLSNRKLLTLGFRRCSRKIGCGLVFSLGEFRPNAKSAHGYHNLCSFCDPVAIRERMLKDLLDSGLKSCSQCSVVKALTEFHRDNSSPTGYRSLCKDCVREYATPYYHANKEAFQERARKWFRDNPERAAMNAERWKERNPDKYRSMLRARSAKREALKRSLPSETVHLREVAFRDGATCWMCGDELSEWNPAHLDHLVPLRASVELLEAWNLSNPGTVRANMALACPTCNIRKSNRVMPCALARYFRNLSAESEIAA